MHTARNDGKATSNTTVDKSSSPVNSHQRAEQTSNPASAAAHKRASTCQKSGSSISDRSQSSGHPAPVHKQRKRRHETPAALADPLGAFACQATQRQRTLQSGLSLLKGKTSQPRIVAHNLTPPNEQLAAQLGTYRFQSVNTAQPAAQPNKGNGHKKGQHSKEHMPQQESHDKHRNRQNGHLQTAMAKDKSKRPPSAGVQPPGQSQLSMSHNSASDIDPAPRQANTNYFQDIKCSLHTLVQAHHTIPSLHAMSDTDKAALTSMLTNKLDGVNILSELQHHFASKPGSAEPPAEQQPSAASSVDCTPSPDSVTQRDAKLHKLPNLSLPCQHAQLRALPFVDDIRTSHASAASSGSGHRHVFAGNDYINSRPSCHRHALTGNGVINSGLTIAHSDGCMNSRLTAADLRSSCHRQALTGNGISRFTVADSDVGLFDLHAEPMETNCSLGQDPGWSCSRENNAMFLDAEAAAPSDSPIFVWYAPSCQQSKLYMFCELFMGRLYAAAFPTSPPPPAPVEREYPCTAQQHVWSM